ncbi:hypothetical protein D3C80_980700 [compost metagenome]
MQVVQGGDHHAVAREVGRDVGAATGDGLGELLSGNLLGRRVGLAVDLGLGGCDQVGTDQHHQTRIVAEDRVDGGVDEVGRHLVEGLVVAGAIGVEVDLVVRARGDDLATAFPLACQLVPALVDVFAKGVGHRVGGGGGGAAVPADAQHVERKGAVSEVVHQAHELAIAAGVGPGAEGGPVQRGAGVGLNQLIGIAIDAHGLLEAPARHPAGVETADAHLHHLALDLVDVQAGDEFEELDGVEQRLAQLGFDRSGDGELGAQLVGGDVVGLGQCDAVFLHRLHGLGGKGLAHCGVVP